MRELMGPVQIRLIAIDLAMQFHKEQTMSFSDLMATATDIFDWLMTEDRSGSLSQEEINRLIN